MINLSEAISRAESAVERGAAEDAIRILQRAAASAVVEESESNRLRGDVCRRLAELLTAEDRLPEAMQAMQEAVDSYGKVPGAEAEAAACARVIVAGVREMWKRPDRLYLLIARLDREMRQLEQRPGTEMLQGDLALKTATILQRRDRFEDAASRYQDALSRFERAEESGEKQATCHHRLAGLYHYELQSPEKAANHYRQAIRLYAEHEPMFEGEQMNRELCEALLRGLGEG